MRHNSTPETIKRKTLHLELVKRRQLLIIGGERLCCTNRVRDSSRESSMVAEMNEQTHTADLQDHELACL